MKLRFTPTALVELDTVLTDLAEISAQGAKSLQARLRQIFTLLQEHPRCGQLTSLQPMRRIVVTPIRA